MEGTNIRINRIKELLAAKEMSQEKFAELIGKKIRQVSNYCQNHNQPRMQDLPVIAKALDVTMDQLIVAEQPEI